MLVLATINYLQIFDTLPDLLTMAKEQASLAGDIYKMQALLREEYRRRGLPFKWSMPMRHTYHCSICNHIAPETLYEVENPHPQVARYAPRLIKLLESEIHQLRFHDGYLKEEYSSFLVNLPPRQERLTPQTILLPYQE
jgi:hypothetical protein